MTTYLISPSEVKLAEKLKAGVIISPLPEEKGADILIYTKRGLVGIQRKSVPNDFLLSITDGRIARETSLLPKGCKFRLLLLEGHFKYWPDGRIAIGRKEPSRFTKAQIHGILFDIKYVKGVDYDYTDDLDDTISYIKTIAQLMDKEKHLSLFSRPGGHKGAWAIPTVDEEDLWLLQSFSGIGPSIAAKIMESFGGKVPLRWSCSLSELKRVPGLSAKRAEKMWAQLSGEIPITEADSKTDFDRMRRILGRIS